MTGFQQALIQIEEWIGLPQGVTAAGAAVWHHGELVAEHYAGQLDNHQPVDHDSLFALASVTKPVAAAVVMTLVEDGLLALDSLLTDFVPEFADPHPDGNPDWESQRTSITIRQLLSHTSGLPEDLPAGTFKDVPEPSRADYLDAMSRTALQSAPGALVRYSNAGFGLLARAVELLTNQDFWDFGRTRLLASMDTSGIVARPTNEQIPRIPTVLDPRHPGTPVETYNSVYWREMAIPWGGLFGSAPGVSAFAGAFLLSAPQQLDAVLARSTRNLMMRDHALGIPGGVESGRVHWPVASWGLGWEVKGQKRLHWTGDLTSPATICHFGQAGTLFWADPSRDLAVALLTNRVVAKMWTFILSRWSRLSNQLVSLAGE